MCPKGSFFGVIWGSDEKKFDFFKSERQLVEQKNAKKIKKNFASSEKGSIFAPAFERGSGPEGGARARGGSARTLKTVGPER